MHIVECLTHSDLGGGQAVVFTLVKNLRSLHPEHRITVILPPGGVYVDRFRALGVNVIEFSLDSILLPGILRASFLFRRIHADVIHSHGKGAGFYARLFPRFYIPALRVHSYHGFHPPNGWAANRFYHILETILLRHTDFVLAVSESEARDVVQRYPTVAAKVRIVANIVDPDDVIARSTAQLDRDLVSFFDKNRLSFVVTMIARNDPVKNHSLAFEACRILCTRKLNIAFVFVGLEGTNPQFNLLKNSFPDRFFSVPVLENPIPLIRHSHVVFLTSRKEAGLPLVFQEAFCCGKPVVGTRVPGIRESVEDGINGLLCDETPLSVADALDLLSRDAELYTRLSTMASTAAKTIHVRDWIGEYVKLYTRALAA